MLSGSSEHQEAVVDDRRLQRQDVQGLSPAVLLCDDVVKVSELNKINNTPSRSSSRRRKSLRSLIKIEENNGRPLS